MIRLTAASNARTRFTPIRSPAPLRIDAGEAMRRVRETGGGTGEAVISPGRWRRRIAGACVLIVGTAFCLIVIDIAARVYQRLAQTSAGNQYVAQFSAATLARLYPGWSVADIGQLWNEHEVNFSYDNHTGFRERPRHGRFTKVTHAGYREVGDTKPWPPDPQATNVFMFGGSTTFGTGVADGETVPAAVQTALRASCRAPVHAYNFGAGSFYSSQERVLFQRLFTAGHPMSAAVFLDGLNDAANSDDAPEFGPGFARLFDMHQGEASVRDAAMGLVHMTALGRFVGRQRARLWHVNTGIPPPPPPGVATGRKAAERWILSVGLVAAGARAAGIVPVIVVQPVRAFGYDLSAHPLGDKARADPWLKTGRAFYEHANARRHEDAGLQRDLLWLANAFDGFDHSRVFVDRDHYTAAFSAHLGQQIGAALARRLPSCA